MQHQKPTNPRANVSRLTQRGSLHTYRYTRGTVGSDAGGELHLLS
jgi:hypothetical protein